MFTLSMPLKRQAHYFSSKVPKKYAFTKGGELGLQQALLYEQTIEELEECEKVWNSIQPEYDNLSHLMIKQNEVKELILMYMTATRQPYVRDSIKTPKIFNRIDQQGHQCLKRMEPFCVKTNKAIIMLNDFNENMEVHASILMSNLSKIKAAKTLKALTKITMPNPNWMQKVPDPETDALTNEWNKAQLHCTMLHVLHQFSQIVPGHVVMDYWEQLKNHEIYKTSKANYKIY